MGLSSTYEEFYKYEKKEAEKIWKKFEHLFFFPAIS